MSGFQNALSAYTGLQAISDKERADATNQRAGNALAGGDYTGAANALYRSGDLQSGMTVTNAGQAQGDAKRKREADGALKLANGMDAMLKGGADPQAAWSAAQQYAPMLGVDPAELAQLKPHYDQDPQAFISIIGQHAQDELKINNVEGVGIVATNARTGKSSLSYGSPGKPIAMDPDKNYIQSDAPTGAPGSTPPPAPSQQAVAPSPAQPAPNADAVWAAMKQRESGGNGNAVSPQGALGSTQMLPATAQAMAQKLGVAWRPDLIQGNSPQALAYQDQLGRAYFDEGVQKYGGDLSKGASYYHGGPNEAIWGPKTRAYAQAVTGGVAAAGGQTPPMQGGAGADALATAPAGYHYIQRAATGGDEGNLTPDAIEQNAMRYVMTGQMPALGQKAKEERNAILNRAAAIAKQYDIKPQDVVTGMAQFKVTAGSLAQVQKTQAMVSASEATLLANIQIAKALIAKGAAGPTGSPLLNGPLQTFRKQALGSADVAQLDQALHNIGDEAAKLATTTTGAGGAGVSDSARGEMYGRLSNAANVRTMLGVMDQMAVEGKNRGDGLGQQSAALTEQLRHGIVPLGQSQTTQVQTTQTQQPAAPQAANGYTSAQVATARQLAQSPSFHSTPLGEPANPYAPRSAAEFEHLPVGKSFINPADGRVLKKTH